MNLDAISRATHLRRSGLGPRSIWAWLGNVRLDTDYICAEADFETKAEVIAL